MRLDVLGADAHLDALTGPGDDGRSPGAQPEPVTHCPCARFRCLDTSGKEVDGPLAEEAGDERRDRVGVHVERSADLMDPSAVDDGDPVAHRHRLDRVVRDVYGRDAVATLEVAQLRAQTLAEGAVDTGERLVEKEDRRHADHRPGHLYEVLVPGRELPGPAMEDVFDVERTSLGIDPPPDFCLGDVTQPEGEPDVLPSPHLGEQDGILEDHRDVPVLRGNVGRVMSTDENRTRGDIVETSDGAQDARLARTGRPDDRHQLAVGDIQADAVEDGDTALVDRHPIEDDGCDEDTSSPGGEGD